MRSTALTAVIDGADIHRPGYWYVLLPCGEESRFMLLPALLVNNLGARRRYPQTWW
ncbi:HPP family protein [uncultured Desulfovibrio sp.]|uniref:HPP family protein n=1 Tax=uncultured Desulfovibrio sp. TaxID=167968 RepID=UPI002632DE2F|nr:HPP family protein [uncultured Desulfovibrio sp.]